MQTRSSENESSGFAKSFSDDLLSSVNTLHTKRVCIIQALKIVADIRASAEHGFMRLTDGQPVEHQPLGLVAVDNPYPAFQFRRVVVKSIFKRKPAVGLQVDDGKHIVRNIHADADEFRRSLKAETAVAEQAQPLVFGIAEQLDFHRIGFGEYGAKQPLKQRRLRHAFAQHAVKPRQPIDIAEKRKTVVLHDGFDAARIALTDQAHKLKPDLRQPRPNGLMQTVGEQVFMVVRIAQDAEEFQPQYPPQCLGNFDRIGFARFQTTSGQCAQMIAGFFVAAFVAVEPAFQIVLVGGVFDESQRVEVFRRQIADDVDTRRRTATFAPAANLVAGAGTSGGSRFAEHGQRQLVNILILRADLRIMRVLPLLGLGDIVMFLGRIRRQQRIRLFAAFGKFAITEDKGLSGHGVGGGRLNVPIIVDRELRGIIRNDASACRIRR